MKAILLLIVIHLSIIVSCNKNRVDPAIPEASISSFEIGKCLALLLISRENDKGIKNLTSKQAVVHYR